jgi:hypothetical protein
MKKLISIGNDILTFSSSALILFAMQQGVDSATLAQINTAAAVTLRFTTQVEKRLEDRDKDDD